MSLADSLLTDLHFERLEEFPSYTSSIKCFGKPIIPALLSQKEKNEISALKEAAVRRESELSRLKKVRNAYYKIQKDDVYNEQNGSLQDDESVLPGMCALSGNYIHSNSSENSSFYDEMHVSTSKMPSTGICSTVHKGVIVCPNEMPASNKYDLPSKYPSNQTFGHQFSSSDCHLCQIDSEHGLCHSIVDNANDQMSSGSDEEEDSIVEDTDFESLPTVVSAKKLNIQDTDDESNVTCLTQSTDLDKYMDCSIEYSSPDDLTAVANSQMSSQITLSCRSDDASSETLVNTESELTPCASAMAELNGCPEDDQKDVQRFCSIASTAAVTTQDRACSVDSYLGMLKTGTHQPQTLPMKKSQSEPSHSDVLRKTASVQEILPKECLDERSGDSVKNIMSEFGSKSESNVRKKNHVRSNSYTLDSPSSALITAHANCGCDLQDAGNKTPHSCTPDKMSKSSMNLAFKKEKVNVVLPPTPDRDKMFPILNSGSFCPQTSDSDFKSSTAESNGGSETSFLDSSVECTESGGSLKNKSKEDFEFAVEELSPVVECSEKVMSAEFEENHQSSFNSSLAEVCSKENSNVAVSDLSLGHSEVKVSSPNESVLDSTNQVFEMSPITENDDKTENIQLILSQIFLDIQESQKVRVNQLLEEQNKQWLQLQEEFKEQERQLCAKLNLVNIPSGFPLDNSKGGIEGNRAEQDISSQLNIRPNVTTLSLNDTSSKESHQNSGIKSVGNSTESPFSEVSDQSNNIQDTFSSDILLTGSSGALHSSALIRDSEFLPSNSVLNETGDVRANTTNKSLQNNQKSVPTIENMSNQSSVISEDAQTNLSVDGGLPSIPQSPVTGTYVSETLTTNASFSRTTEVPSSLSLTHDNDFPFSSTESLKVNYDYQNILLQSSNDLPSLAKFYPVPVSGVDFVSTPSTPKRSILTCSMGSHQNKGNLPPQFCSKGEMCVLSPMSPCICVAVHEQEFNAECPNCHACMNCDTNCLKHVNYSKGDFQEVNGYTSWDNPNLSNCDTPDDQSNPLVSGLPSGKQGHITQGSVNGDTPNDHFVNTQDCDDDDDDEKGLLKENIDLNQMSLIRKAIIENKNFIEKNGNVPHKHITRKLTSAKHASKTHSTSSSLYSFSKNITKPKNLVTTRSPKKGDRNSPLSQKSRKTQDASLISKADALKKLVFPSAIGIKRIHSREVLETMNDPSIQKKLERLPAMVKGYLTRRLFNSERVQDLVKTLKDTVLIIGKLSEELTSKANPVSEQDVDFHRQLIVQLMTTFRNVYDIFCTYSIKEQMKIISESRNIRLKKKSEENNANAVSPAVSETSNSSLPSKNPKISAATVKSLERKRRSSLDNRTYTIEDFKGCRPRICTKAQMSSPSRIYRSGMDLNLKSKSKSAKTPHWK